MRFVDTDIAGVSVVYPDLVEDERGFFARAWSRREMDARGFPTKLDHVSHSWNRRSGTLRGMHYQEAPSGEAKLIACLRGLAFDVVVDLRWGSRTYGRWTAAHLTPRAMEAMYVPPGCAHGFMSLEDDTVVQYMVSGEWRPDHARGLRWDDSAVGIRWPSSPTVIDPRDLNWPPLTVGATCGAGQR